MTNYSIQYISRCLELAGIGLGSVQPNPMVGCVIVHNGIIIGEGYHQKYGGPHAEVNAINSVKDKELLKESTLYVNLEPCVHYGKTPPCTDLILKYNIPEVVVSLIDCYSEVAGKGVRKLQRAGVNVTLGILSKESKELNKRFYTYYEKKRPYIILKWAETIDGYIDIYRDNNTPNGAAWITNEYSDMLVHKWRSEEDAIMVGTNTALNDNPQLNVRHYHGKNPLRIVIDRNLRLPDNLNLFNKTQPTLVFTEKVLSSEFGVRSSNQCNPNPNPNPTFDLEYVKIDFNSDVCKQILDELYNRKTQSIIIEGGKTLLESFINADLWDEARVFICNKSFVKGKEAPKLKILPVSKTDISGDTLLFYKNTK